MPYAPGEHYAAGDYFAQVGPRLAQNIQNWMQGREERDQAVASAEMLGRYLKDDPQAMEMFGDKLSKIHSMSTGAAKAVLGEGAMYLTQRHLKQLEDAQKAQTGLQQQEMQIRAGEAAHKYAEQGRLANFNRELSQEVNPPLMFNSAAGAGPGPISPEIVARVMARTGTAGRPETTALYNAAASYAQRNEGLPLGTVQQLPGGAAYYGMGKGNAPHLALPKEPTAAKGLDFGVTQETPEGTLIGMGPNNEPKFLASADKSKPSTLDQGFIMYTPIYAHQLDAAEEAVKKFSKGKAIGFWSSPEAVATMQQLPSLLANSFAKITDPSGTVRDSDREEFIKRLFPQGNMTRADVTLAALDKLKDDLAVRTYTWGANQKEVGKIPGGMPNSLTTRVKSMSSKASPDFTSADQVRKALDAGQLTWDEAAAIITQKFGAGGSVSRPTGGASGTY